MLIQFRVLLFKEDMMNSPTSIHDRSELLTLGHLIMEVRRPRRDRRRHKELRRIIHQRREQREAVVLNVLGVQQHPQRLHHGALALPLGRGLLGLGVDDVVDGGEELVHALPVGGVGMLLGVDEEDAGEVVVGHFGLEEFVLGIGTVDILGDLFLELFVLEVLVPDVL